MIQLAHTADIWMIEVLLYKTFRSFNANAMKEGANEKAMVALVKEMFVLCQCSQGDKIKMLVCSSWASSYFSGVHLCLGHRKKMFMDKLMELVSYNCLF